MVEYRREKVEEVVRSSIFPGREVDR